MSVQVDGPLCNDIRFQDGESGHWIDCSNQGTAGVAITGNLWLLDRLIFQSDARYIIVVEKVSHPFTTFTSSSEGMQQRRNQVLLCPGCCISKAVGGSYIPRNSVHINHS
eukprot:TRINITY_DN75370_c0_g2_i1.p1 TRINITY_DN75370_c0_g2~~TRINITY_DN75370_c0_g2_i1.p1  ORF type:complete len:110 (+),score=0.15 TRINITY_DN75370_c0_g2_i1:174-503(+)